MCYWIGWYNMTVFKIGDESDDYWRVLVMSVWGSQYCLPFADDGSVYATGLNDFGQLGVSKSKHYSVVWFDLPFYAVFFCLVNLSLSQ